MSKYWVAALCLLVALAGIVAQTNEAPVGSGTAVPTHVAPSRAPNAAKGSREGSPASKAAATRNHSGAQQNATGAVITPTKDGANAELPKADHQPIGFTGYYKDTESGLYYAKARYYDPRIARFTTPDPLEGSAMQPPSLHRYLYAYANPTVYTDPSGRCADAACSWGLGMAYANNDDDRASVTRAALNTNPMLGRSAGALYEGGMQFASPAQLASDAAVALQGDLEAQQRWGNRANAVQAFGNRMQDARDRYGDAGPAVQLVDDFAQGAGQHAAQFEVRAVGWTTSPKGRRGCGLRAIWQQSPLLSVPRRGWRAGT
jgi:RHS repeat-associated protein